MTTATPMEPVRIILSGLWVALMLTYLLGDVLRIFAGDFTAGKMQGKDAAWWMWPLAAAVMLLPIAMVVLSLTLPCPTVRWVAMAVAGFLILFNLAGLPYPAVYDNVLIAVGLVLAAVIIWYGWTWTS